MSNTGKIGYWKSKVTRLGVQARKLLHGAQEFEPAFEFPTDPAALTAYVRQKSVQIQASKANLQQLESRIEAVVKEGFDLIDESTTPEQVTQIEHYTGTVGDQLTELLDMFEILNTRSIELELQRQELSKPFVRSHQLNINPPPLEEDHSRRQRRVSTESSDRDGSESVFSFGGPQRNRPRQQLPKFKGEIKKFPSFWTGYSAMIHAATDLTDLDKFFYLRQALKDNALSLIEEIPVTGENYKKAISLLKNRYDIGSTVTTVMIAEIQNLRPASTATKSIRSTLEQLRQKICTLECQGERFQDTNVWRSLILSKFPAAVNSHVIKGERRMTKRSSAAAEEGKITPSSFAVEELIAEIAEFVLLQECIEMNLESQNNRVSETSSGHSQKLPDRKSFKSTADRKDFKFNKNKVHICICQSDQHKPQNCPQFPTPALKRQEAKRIKCCWKCFDRGHQSKDCTALGPCPKCQANHHSTLCENTGQSPSMAPATTPTMFKKPPPKTTLGQTFHPSGHTVMVTAEDTVQNVQVNVAEAITTVSPESDTQIVMMQAHIPIFSHSQKKTVILNGFFDSGASRTYVRDTVAVEHGLVHSTGEVHTVSAVGGKQVSFNSRLVKLLFQGVSPGTPDKEILVRTMPLLCKSLRSGKLSEDDYRFILKQKLQLNTQVTRSDPNSVDLIIGQDLMESFIDQAAPRFYLPSGLLLTKTIYGYTVSGRGKMPESWIEADDNRIVLCSKPKNLPCIAHSAQEKLSILLEDDCLLSFSEPVRNKELEEFKADIRNLYNLESLGIQTAKDETEEHVLKFMNNYRRTIKMTDGRVEAGFPFLEEVNNLQDNFKVAARQLQNQLIKLKAEHLELYENTFNDYLKQGMIEEVSLEKTDGRPTFYLPHHPVITPDKSTSFRVVFNASSKAKGELSLNDVIFPGYSLLSLIFEVLLKFRTHDFVMVADIQKAFLQIMLPEEHRDVTRFLWVKNPSLPPDRSNLVIYRFTRMPFGVNAAPAILNQSVLKHLEEENNENAAEIAETLYVDNVALHATSESDLFNKYMYSKNVFKKLGMRLRDFLSNSSLVNASIPDEDRSAVTELKMLGIPWNSVNDTFSLSLNSKSYKKLTMRTVLSQVNGACYDPLGLLSPFFLHMKVFLQSLHKRKKKWNDELNDEETEEWNKILDATTGVEVTLPRTVTQESNVKSRSLMVFSDSSKKAYCAVAYVTTVTTSGEVFSRIFTGKMKITPIKEVTIPRLELTGILVASKLADSILSHSGLTFDAIHLFSDSTIAIAWVQSKKLLPPFVKELSSKIQSLLSRIREKTKLEIHHVSTDQNPADLGTRGLERDSDHSLWFNGPNWITLPDRDDWPTNSMTVDTPTGEQSEVYLNLEQLEGKRDFDVNGGIFPVSQISSYSRLQRISAYVVRFLKHVAKAKLQKVSTCSEEHPSLLVSAAEYRNAERLLILQEQRKVNIPQMIRECKKLHLFIDSDGLLRKKSRFNHSHMSYDMANPIYLPQKSLLSNIIVTDIHTKNFHRKDNHLHDLVQQRFWIPNVRRLIKKFTNSCFICSVYGRPYKYPDLPDLPAERVNRSTPFSFSGIDLFGPVFIKNSSGDEEKRWVCLFTCFATRMIHLEIVNDCSARAFLLSFRRFCSRRGVPQKIWSDNGTNFVLGSKILEEGDADIPPEIAAFVASEHISWTFIPPAAPWHGGTWERAVALVKKPLLQAIGRRRVSEDTLHTLICQVEAVVNSRPIYFSSNENELVVLRPVDFCQPRLLLCPAKPDIDNPEDPQYLPQPLQKSRASAMKAIADVERGLDRFWKTFNTGLLSRKGAFDKKSLDYASTTLTPKIGDLVLINEDKEQPRHFWPRGTIVSVLKGKDGGIRSADVRTANGSIFRRPVNKLIPLDTSDKPQEEPVAERLDNHRHLPELLEQPESRRRPHRRATQPMNTMTTVSTLLTLGLVSCLLPGSTAVPLKDKVLSCISGGVLLNLDHTGISGQLTSELCVNDKTCSTLIGSGIQTFYVGPSTALADYSVQWRTLHDTKQMLELINCKGTPTCDSIDCWLCQELFLNPHCWPKATLALAVLYTYTVIVTLLGCWICCCRNAWYKFQKKLYNVLTACGSCLQHIADRCCPQKTKKDRHVNLSASDNAEQIPLIVVTKEVRRRIQPSTLVIVPCVLLCVIFFLPSAHASQRISMMEADFNECLDNQNSSCTQIHSVTVTMSSLRRELTIRAQWDEQIHRQLKVRLENLTMECLPSSLYYTRDVNLVTHSAKRCPLAGSCDFTFCNTVSSRTEISEFAHLRHLPGIARCSESCGALLCGCALPLPGCLFSRTVAEPTSDEVYILSRCNYWVPYGRLIVEEMEASGNNRKYLIRVRQGQTISMKSINVTFDFFATPPLPVLNSMFLVKLKSAQATSEQSSTALMLNDDSDLPIHCSSPEAAQNLTRCFLKNTCSCTHSTTVTNCLCSNFNITAGLESLQHRLPITSPLFSIHIKKGKLIATPREAVAEFTLVSQHTWNTQLVSSAPCSVAASEVTGCYNCVSGGWATVNCVSTQSQIATISCRLQSFALQCSPNGTTTSINVIARTTEFEDHCAVSCSALNVTLTGTLMMGIRSVVSSTEGSGVNDNMLPDWFKPLNDLFDWNQMSSILALVQNWWKTSLLLVLLPVAAVAAILLSCPVYAQWKLQKELKKKLF